MKAAVFVEKEKIEIQDIPRPEIGTGEVLLKVEYSGICGSDVHAFQSGQLYSPGTVMGHEFSATVTEIEEAVEGFEIGDRVAVSPGAACRECYYCIRGVPNLCIGSNVPVIGLFDKLRLLNNIVGPDIIFECAGIPETFNMALSLARRDGQVVVVSIIEQETPIYPFVLAVNEVELKGCYGFVSEDFKRVISYMAGGRLAADRMISQVISLNDIVEKGFNALLKSPEKLKILVKPL